MPKATKTHKSTAASNDQRDFHSLRRWQCRHHKKHSDIVAFIEADETWQPVATVHSTHGVDAEVMASYVATLVNQHHEKQDLLRSAMVALEALVNEGLTFDTEQEADSVLKQMKNLK